MCYTENKITNNAVNFRGGLDTTLWNILILTFIEEIAAKGMFYHNIFLTFKH